MADGPIISFPRMGNYHIPVKKLLEKVFPGHKIVPAPPITSGTLELGCRHSPDFICAPFKFNVGNFIEALEAGADILLQTGTGCRCGYYGEAQERILRDLGYDFKFVLLSRENASPKALYKTAMELGSPLSPAGFLSAVLAALESVRLMDAFEYYMRENMAFESVPDSFETLRQAMLADIERAEGLPEVWGIRRRYLGALRRIGLDRPENPLRVGLVGELFTLMEPFSNFYLEEELAKSKISVSRRMSVTFLLWGGVKNPGRECGGYLRSLVGANGADSVAQSLRCSDQGYDGIIHMKSFGCAPELNAVPALGRLSRDKNIPVLELSFDAHTSEEGLKTRIEAFTDMLSMRRQR